MPNRFKQGDPVRLSQEFLDASGYVASKIATDQGYISDIFTDWDKDDFVCWDYTVVFNNHSYGFHDSDLVLVDDIADRTDAWITEAAGRED